MEEGKGTSEVVQVPPQPDKLGLGSIPHHLLLGIATGGGGKVFEEELEGGRDAREGGRKET